MLVPTLTITDNGNGTGATATIANGDPLATNVISTQLVSASGFVNQATITGNGSASLSLAANYYWGVCTSSLSGQQVVSNLVYFPVSTGTDAVHYRIMTALQAQIQTLTLTNLPSSQVYVRMALDNKTDLGVTFPCILITPTSRETFDGGTNMRDDMGFPCVVYIADINDENYIAKLPLYLKWREQLLAFFRFQHLIGIPEVFALTKVEPNTVIDPEVSKYQHIISAFTLRFPVRMPRGVL